MAFSSIFIMPWPPPCFAIWAGSIYLLILG